MLEFTVKNLIIAHALEPYRIMYIIKTDLIIMIGIIVAMQKELDLLLGILDDCRLESINGYDFYLGRVGDAEVVAMTCGIGKVNAALGTAVIIDNFHPDVVVNSGVAGGTGADAGVLDVVLASGIAYHDVWCGPGTQWGEAAGCPPRFSCPDEAAGIASVIGVKYGLITSGDIFVSREEDLKRILGVYPEAIAVDMESGAIAQTCYLRGVPMYCIRVVSDTPGAADNISQYENFWSDAPRHTFSAVRKLIERLKKA